MYIVTDIGGTNMRVAAVSGDTLGEIKKVPTPKDPVEGIATFATLARECAHGEKITGVAGCIAADKITETGEMSGARNLPAWEAVRITSELSNALGAPVHLVNDAALAGLGEAFFGAGRGAASVAYITVSTGVGGGWIVDGKIAGSGGTAEIKINGVDLESLVSGTAVRKKFGIHPKDLSSLDERNKLADLLAEGLTVIAKKWPSEVIVVGGSMIVGVNPVPLTRVQESFTKLFTDSSKLPIIKMAELGDNGGLWGGIALLKQTA